MYVGLLTMSSAVSTIGIIPGSIVICIVGMASGLGLYLLSECAAKIANRQSSFFAVSSITFPHASVFIDLAIAIKQVHILTYLSLFGWFPL
jgi:amino acid permease